MFVILILAVSFWLNKKNAMKLAEKRLKYGKTSEYSIRLDWDYYVPKCLWSTTNTKSGRRDTAVKILHKAYDGGIRFFDAARSYSDSEEKLSQPLAKCGIKFCATKTAAKTPADF